MGTNYRSTFNYFEAIFAFSERMAGKRDLREDQPLLARGEFFKTFLIHSTFLSSKLFSFENALCTFQTSSLTSIFSNGPTLASSSFMLVFS